MRTKLNEVMKDRRSIRRLGRKEGLLRTEVEDMLRLALYAPSAYNMQSSKMVLLMDGAHEKFWDLTLEALRKKDPPEAFARTQTKLDGFRGGNGTVLFYEDREVVERYKKDFSLYAGYFDQWSQHNNAMLQYALWLVFTEARLGASLQHYNPLIDSAAAAQWDIPKSHVLIAQMPFGKSEDTPAERQWKPFEEVVRVYD